MRAHGLAVGLPSDDDMGNSEVGHNALGAGRVFEQITEGEMPPSEKAQPTVAERDVLLNWLTNLVALTTAPHKTSSAGESGPRLRSGKFTLSADDQRYVVGVLNDRNSRGGSRYVHEQLRVGAILPISVPRSG